MCNGYEGVDCVTCMEKHGACPEITAFAERNNQRSDGTATQIAPVATLATGKTLTEVVMKNPTDANPNPATTDEPAAVEIADNEEVILDETDVETDDTDGTTHTEDEPTEKDAKHQADRESARNFLEQVCSKVLAGIGKATSEVDLSEAHSTYGKAYETIEERPGKAKFLGYLALSEANQAQGIWNLDQASQMIEAHPTTDGTKKLAKVINDLRKHLSLPADKITRECRNLSKAAFELRKQADRLTGKARANSEAEGKARTTLTELEAKLREDEDLARQFGQEVAQVRTLIETGNGFEARKQAEALELTIDLKEVGVDISGCDPSGWNFEEVRQYHREDQRGQRRNRRKNTERATADRANSRGGRGPKKGK